LSRATHKEMTMIPLLPIVGPWLVGKLLSAKPGRTEQRATFLAGAVQVAGLVVLGVAAFLIWDWRDDRAAIRAHEAERVAETLAAERRASANDLGRHAARSAASVAVQQELEEIHAQDPQAAAAPAGRGTRAVADRLPAR